MGIAIKLAVDKCIIEEILIQNQNLDIRKPDNYLKWLIHKQASSKDAIVAPLQDQTYREIHWKN